MKLRNWILLCIVQQVWPSVPDDTKSLGMRSSRHVGVHFFPHRNLVFCQFDQKLLSRARTEQPVFLRNSTSRQSGSCVEAELATPLTALFSPTSVTTFSPLPGQSTPVHPEQNSASITPRWTKKRRWRGGTAVCSCRCLGEEWRIWEQKNADGVL